MSSNFLENFSTRRDARFKKPFDPLAFFAGDGWENDIEAAIPVLKDPNNKYLVRSLKGSVTGIQSENYFPAHLLSEDFLRSILNGGVFENAPVVEDGASEAYRWFVDWGNMLQGFDIKQLKNPGRPKGSKDTRPRSRSRSKSKEKDKSSNPDTYRMLNAPSGKRKERKERAKTYNKRKKDEEGFNEVERILGRPLVRKPNVLQKSGAFFPFRLGTNFLDFDYAQVYSEVSDEFQQEQCLIHTLRYFGVDESLLQIVMVKYTGHGIHIPRKDFKDIARLCRAKIYLSMYRSDEASGTMHSTITPEEWDIEVKLGFYKEHFFPEIDTGYSRYYLRNLEKVENWVLQGTILEEDKSNVVREGRRGVPVINKSNPTLTTAAALRELSKHGYFHEKATPFRMGKRPDVGFLSAETVEAEQEAWEFKEASTVGEQDLGSILFAADFESYIQGRHEPCLSAVIRITEGEEELKVSDVRLCDGSDPVQQLFTAIVFTIQDLQNQRGGGRFSKKVVFFHNLRYDRTLFEQHPQVRIESVCEKGGSVYSMRIRFNGIQLEIRDSLKMINVGISRFASAFQLPPGVCKQGDYILYDYFTPANRSTENSLVSVEEYSSNHVFSDDVKENEELRIKFNQKLRTFLNDPDKSPRDCYFGPADSFLPWVLYRYYLRYDVLVLALGLQKFRHEFGVITENKLNIFDSLTISSFANRYMGFTGCFDGAYSYYGTTREFISKAIYGGRVFCNPAYEGREVTGKLDYFDACSLYPSAIKFICEQSGGFPTGPCSFLQPEQLDYAFLRNETTEYTVEIKISAIRKQQHSVPFIAYRSTDSGLQYLNALPGDLKSIIVTVDKQTLEDYIAFHLIEFEVLRGVFWTGPKNTKWGEVISGLYEERLKCKRLGHGVRADNLKLVMNSAYGKTIMKPTLIEKVFAAADKRDDSDDSKWKRRLISDFHLIKEFRWIGEHQLELTRFAKDETFTLCKYGSMILAASKHLMNQVFDLMSENEMNIYYTDTDSFVMDQKDQKQLAQLFQDKYDRPLIGDSLGQMHSDFTMKLDGKAVNPIHIWSSAFFPMSKKLYLHRIHTILPDGKTASSIQFKCKGCTTEGLTYEAAKLGAGDEGFIALYRKLSQGEEIDIPLNPPGKATKFVYSKDNRVSTPTEVFYRKIKSPAAQLRVGVAQTGRALVL